MITVCSFDRRDYYAKDTINAQLCLNDTHTTNTKEETSNIRNYYSVLQAVLAIAEKCTSRHKSTRRWACTATNYCSNNKWWQR